MASPVVESRFVAGLRNGTPGIWDVLHPDPDADPFTPCPTVDDAAADARRLSGAWNLARAVLDPPGGELRRAS